MHACGPVENLELLIHLRFTLHQEDKPYSVWDTLEAQRAGHSLVAADFAMEALKKKVTFRGAAESGLYPKTEWLYHITKLSWFEQIRKLLPAITNAIIGLSYEIRKNTSS